MANSFSIRGQYQSNIEQGLAHDKAAFAGLGTTANQHLGTVSTGFGKVGTAASKMSGALSHAKGAIGGLLTGPLGMVGLAGGAIGLEKAITGVIGASRSYGSSMTLLQTQTGASADEVKKMSGAVLDLAKSLPQGPNELAAGLYHIESAGMRGSKALDVLRIAAQGAATGGADLESVTNALVGAEQSGIKGAEDLGIAMGTLNAIVGAGNMRMQDLADAMSSGIAATAKTFGASLQSVGAALATLTDEGIPAIDAATRLRMTINLLGAPSSKARNLFKDIGLSATDLATAMRGPQGLVGAVSMLHEAMAKAGMIDSSGITTKGAQFLSGAFGGGRSSSAIMTLIGNMDLVDKKFAAVNKGAAGFGDAVATATQTAGWKFATFQSKVEVLAVRLGNVLLPVAADIADSLGKIIGDPSTEQSLVGGLTAAVAVGKDLAGVLGTVFGSLMSAWSAVPAPLQQLLVGGEILGKTSKFLFGIDFSPTALGSKIASGMVGALGKSLAMSTAEGVEKGLVASALGKAFVQPVFVTNWAMMGGGGVAGAAEGALGGAAATVGEMGLIATITAITPILLAGAAGAAIVQWLGGYDPRNSKVGPGTGGATGGKVIMSNALDLPDPNKPRQPYVRPSDQQHQHYLDTNAGIDRTFIDQQKSHFDELNSTVGTVTKAVDELHADLQAQLAVLKTSKDPAAIAAAAAKIAEDVANGAGGVTSTKNMLADLKAQRAAATDPTLIKALDAAIRKVEAKIPGREWIAKQLSQGDKILHSDQTSAQKITALTKIQADLKAHGDTVAANIIKKEIDSLKSHIDATTDAVKGLRMVSGGTGTMGTVPHFVASGNQAAPHGRASGGSVSAGVAYKVGEGGVELFVPGQDGTVIPNKPSAALLNAVEGRSLMSGRTPTQENILATAMRDMTRQNAGNAGNELKVNVQLSAAHGIITPGVARQIMQELGPLMLMWLQRNGVLPRTGTPIRG